MQLVFYNYFAKTPEFRFWQKSGGIMAEIVNSCQFFFNHFTKCSGFSSKVKGFESGFPSLLSIT